MSQKRSLAKENVPISSIIHYDSTEELAHVGFPAVSLWAGSRNLIKAPGCPSHMKSVTSSYAYSRHPTLCQELVQGNIPADDKCNLTSIQKAMLMHCIRLCPPLQYCCTDSAMLTNVTDSHTGNQSFASSFCIPTSLKFVFYYIGNRRKRHGCLTKTTKVSCSIHKIQ